MRNVYKKVGVLILSGVLLVGAPLSNGLVSYANSIESNIYNNRCIFSKYSDIADVKGCQKIYSYSILKHNPSDAYIRSALKLGAKYGSEKSGKKYHIHIKDFYLIFKDGYDFKQYLLNKGMMKQGIYKIKVGEDVYILKFYRNVPPGIKVFDHIDKWVYSREGDILKLKYAQSLYNFKVFAINPDRKFVSNLLKNYSSVYVLYNDFRSVSDFINYLQENRNKLSKGFYRIFIEGFDVIIRFN